jgi:hypothetical protein
MERFLDTGMGDKNCARTNIVGESVLVALDCNTDAGAP